MRKTIFAVFIAFYTYSAFCQSLSPAVISGAGNAISHTDCYLQYTLGECVIETFAQSETTLTQGFHQVFSDELSAMPDNDFQDERIKMYPNPAKNVVYICLPELEAGKTYTVHFFDMLGNSRHTVSLVSHKQKISLANVIPGNYILVVKENNQRIFSSLILKTQ